MIVIQRSFATKDLEDIHFLMHPRFFLPSVV